LSKHITIHSIKAEETFPNVTLPYFFEVLGADAREHALMETVAFAPLVAASQVRGWDYYSVSNQDWIAESQRFYDGGDGAAAAPSAITPFLYTYQETGASNDALEKNFVSGQGPHLPLWQVSPPPIGPSTEMINFDVLSTSVGASLMYRVFAGRKGTRKTTISLYSVVKLNAVVKDSSRVAFYPF